MSLPPPSAADQLPARPGPEKDRNRRRRELTIIIVLTLIIAGIFYIESHLPNLPTDLPLLGNIIVFALININIILLLLLIFLILRNLIKLLLGRKRKIVGFRLRTKLVLAFISLSMFPTILLFVAATGFIRYSLDNWFSTNFESSLDASLVVAQEYYDNLRRQNQSFAANIAADITRNGLLIGERSEPVKIFLDRKRAELGLDAIAVIRLPQNLVGSLSLSPVLSHEQFLAGIDLGDRPLPRDRIIPLDDGAALVQGWAPILSVWQGEEVIALTVTVKLVPAALAERMENISGRYTAYKKAKNLELYIKSNYILTFVLITALITFISIWFGFYLAKDITAPVHELALATREIAGGNLNFSIDMVAGDELGILVESFNSMTEKLLASRRESENANLEMSRISAEHAERRRYMETILENINSGVIVIDRGGRITTINRAAERIFEFSAADKQGESYRNVFPQELIQKIRQYLKESQSDPQRESSIELTLPESSRYISIHFSPFYNDADIYIGMLILINDMTELVKAQKTVAWREVARRIAHEIKNPLTPIALSAQRIQKKYGSLAADGDNVLRECTSTIVRQVNDLKSLVNEFSSFARMPQARPTLQNLNTIIEESLILYRQSHPQIKFSFEADRRVPDFFFDHEQLKRAMTNLIDNALAALQKSEEGRIWIATRLDKSLEMVIIELNDNGPGIDEKTLSRLFEPYFSTKKRGTGLGLTIVKTIINDHRGFIRVRENHLKGTCFVIEMPIINNAQL
ncbi:MAG: PAS domain-containing protein [Deltaproteobacteria bacterium]|nr:PAS domain-containing protein [Deltaproteobacteria bacterium]